MEQTEKTEMGRASSVPSHPGKRICKLRRFWFNHTMSLLEKVEAQVKQLSTADQEALRNWLEDLLEDESEFTDEFKAKIAQAESDISEGRGRVLKP
jgi:hypothetical protein